MIYPDADKLEAWGSKYSLVVLAAKRAKQIKGGAPPLVPTDSRNPLTIALEEIAAGKILCQVPDTDIPPKAAEEPEVAQLLAIPSEPLGEEEEEHIPTSETLVIDEEEYEEEEEEDETEEEELSIGEDFEEESEEEEPPYIGDEESEEPLEDEPEDISAISDDEPKPKARRGRKAKTEPDIPDIDDIDLNLDEVEDEGDHEDADESWEEE